MNLKFNKETLVKLSEVEMSATLGGGKKDPIGNYRIAVIPEITSILIPVLAKITVCIV